MEMLDDEVELPSSSVNNVDVVVVADPPVVFAMMLRSATSGDDADGVVDSAVDVTSKYVTFASWICMSIASASA